MKYLFSSFIIILFLFIACEGVQEGDQPTDFSAIQVKDVPDNTLNFLDIAEDFRYIRLETGDESLIGTVDKLIFAEDGIFVLDRTSKALYSFDFKGNFIKQIGSTGRGPGEWLDPQDVSFDKENKRLVLYCRGTRKMLFYSTDGDFIKEIDTGLRFRSMEYINEDTIFIVTHRILNVLPDSKELAFDLISLNLDMDILHKQFPNNLVLGKSAGTFSDGKYLCNSDHGIFLNFYFNDTIYKIGNGSQGQTLFYILTLRAKGLIIMSFTRMKNTLT